MYMFNRSIPLVWRSESCLQLGIDEPVLIDGLTEADRQLIELIKMGVSSQLLTDKAAELGLTPDRCASLIRLLGEARVLIPQAETQPSTPTPHTDALAQHYEANPAHVERAIQAAPLICTGPLARDAQELATRTGLKATVVSDVHNSTVPAHAFVILTAIWTPDLMNASFLQNQGISHAHAVVGQQTATVTHVIHPGFTPCLSCVTHYLIDADEEWMAGWKGLREQAPTPGRVDPLLAAGAVTTLVHTVRHHLLNDMTLPLMHTLSIDSPLVTEQRATFHSACECRSATAVAERMTSSTLVPN